jgi:hypothetical protein
MEFSKLTNYSTNMCQSGQGATIPRPEHLLAVPVSVLCVGLEKGKLLVIQTWM